MTQIEATARLALAAGYDVIMEGVFNLRDYGALLRQLHMDHRGQSRYYQFDIGLDETIDRHQRRPLRSAFGPDEIREWYDGWQPLPFTTERRLGPELSTDAIVHLILDDFVPDPDHPREVA